MKKFLKSSVCVACLTIVSQALGYIREMLFACYLGTNIYLEAFQVAETIPLLFTQVLISAVPLALTPLLVRERENNKETLIHSAFALWTSVLLVICITVWVFPQKFVKIVAPGFNGEIFDITCQLVVILVPNIFCLSFTALYNAYLNSHNQFVIPALIALLLNFSLVCFQLITKANVFWVAKGAVLGGFLMLLMLVLYCGKKYKLCFNIKKIKKQDVKLIILAILPVCIAASFTSLNLMLDKFFASKLESGAVAILSYSYKVINLPVYLFVTSISRVLLPDLTRAISKKERSQITNIIRKIVLFCICGGAMAVVLIQFFGKWAIAVIFGRGAFDSADILATSRALQCYSFGIAGMALNSFFQSVSYAGGHFYEPLKLLLIQVLLYFFVTQISIRHMGVYGIVLGNVVAVTVTSVVWLFIIKKIYNINILRRTN